MSNTYNVGWLRDNENQIFIPFTYTKSVKLDDKGNTLDSTVTLVDEHTDAIAGINEILEKIQNGNIHAGIADSTKGTLSIGNKHFNGSENLTVEAKDLGITGALVYRGISTTPITDKGTEAPFIDNATVAITDLEPGNIVLYNANGEIYQEYLWTGDHWELLGDEGSYAYRSITVEAGAGLTGGGTLAQDFGLSVVPDNHTVVIDDNNRVAMKQLTSAGSYGQEADIPDLEPQATREFKVPYFTVDNYGRITSAQTKTIQIVNDSEVMDAIARIEADIAGDSGEVDNIVPRLAQVETRTKYIDASSDEGVFQIVDGEGKIGVQVDDQGVKSFDFILSNGNVSLVQKLKALDEKDTALTDGISDIEARTVTAGAGLTGGGSLADSMTINIGKGTGIQINEDSIQLEAVENLSTGSFGESENYTKGFNNSFTIPHITVDEYGRITAVKSVTINMPQDGAILDNISKVEEDLTKLINDTKTELQGNIDNVNTTLDSKIDNINTTLNTKIDNVKSALDKKDEELSDTLGKEVTALNNTITEQVNALSERINTNKTNIESNDIDIGNLDQRVSANEKEIEDIHKLDDEQNDNISNLETRAANLETRTQFMDASIPDEFHITDEQGYPGFTFGSDGIARAQDFITSSTTDEDNNISLKETKKALDTEIKNREEKDTELADAIDDTNLRIDKMDITTGYDKQPIYFNNGTPTACVENFTFYEEIGVDDVDPSTSSTFCVLKTGDTMSGPLISTGFIGPLTGTADNAKKLVDSNNQGLSLGDASNPVYFNGGVPVACTGTTVPTGGSDGQVLIKNSDGTSSWKELVALPKGGTAGHVLIKNSETDGDASWKELVALPKGGIAGQVLVKNSETDGDASWATDISGNAATASTLAQIKLTGNPSDDSEIGYRLVASINVTTWTNRRAVYSLRSRHSGNGILSIACGCNSSTISEDTVYCDIVLLGWTGTVTYNDAWISYYDSTNSQIHIFWKYQDYNSTILSAINVESKYINLSNSGAWMTSIPSTYGIQLGTYKKAWIQGDAVTGAVWNDYAECRESDCEEFGYVLMENGDDTLSKTAERLSHFAGVSSDTWGFSQGETVRAHTPIAVAGRVLVYPYQDRNNYKPGDCVCAAPNGTVDIMTREEVINWPDRIVGTVSCVPDYEEWGGGQDTDRPSVKVNGRIWIKVK